MWKPSLVYVSSFFRPLCKLFSCYCIAIFVSFVVLCGDVLLDGGQGWGRVPGSACVSHVPLIRCGVRSNEGRGPELVVMMIMTVIMMICNAAVFDTGLGSRYFGIFCMT